MDSAARQKIIENRGFCNYHFYKMLTAASKPTSPDGHGIALINKSIIEALIEDFHERKAQQISNFDKLLATENSCPVCVHIEHFSERYISKTLELISSGNEDFFKYPREVKGLLHSTLCNVNP